jgi:SAM-dependent methyltransferase
MLAEAMVWLGHQLIRNYPPEGRSYWASRFWDRAPVETTPGVNDDLRVKQELISSYVTRYGKDARRVLEFSCGTGEFTKVAASLTSAPEIVAVDISEHALEIARRRVTDPRLRFVQGDFWADLGVGTADLVMCINAIHHMGDVRAVMEHLMTFVEPGGTLIGNVWTMENYHEFQRSVHGPLRHNARSALFLANAVVMRATGGRIRWASYRTQLLPARKIESIVRIIAPEVLEVANTRYFVIFACRR